MSDSGGKFESSGTFSESVAAGGGRGGSRPAEGLRSKDLTDRMVHLIEKISEYDYLTIREVGLIYSNQTHAYHVLNVLKEKGLVMDFKTSLKPRTAFCLSSKGYRLLAQVERLRVERRFRPQDLQIHFFKHKTACAAVGLILEKHPLIRGYIPENLLWKQKRYQSQKVCDAEFWFKTPGQYLGQENAWRVGLEIELTLKNRDKLADTFRDLKRRDDLEHVWWICGDMTVLRALVNCIRDRVWLSPQGHFLTTLDRTLRKKHQLVLEDKDYDTHTIDPEDATWPPAPIPGPKPYEETQVKVQGDESISEKVEPKPVPERDEAKHPGPPGWLPEETRRTRFKWRYLLAVIMLVLAVYGIRTAVQTFVHTPKAAPVKPMKPVKLPGWQQRQITSKKFTVNGWGVNLIFLRSKGNRYKLTLKLLNYDQYYASMLLKVAVFDSEGHALGTWDLHNVRVPAQHHWQTKLAFHGPRSARRFTVVFWPGEVKGYSNVPVGIAVPVKFR